MFTVTRDHKIADLKTKLSHWHSAEGQAKYINGIATNEGIFSNRFGIDAVSGGYYYLSDSLVGFYDMNTGNSIRIKKLTNGDTNWNCYNALYQKSLTADFRIEAPGHREVISIDGQDWDYAEITSPNGEYGTTYEHDVFDWPPLTNGLTPNPLITAEQRAEHVALLKSNVDEVYKIYPHLVEIATANNAGLPSQLLNMSSIYRDSVGTFWSDINFDDWTIPNEEDIFLQIYNQILAGSTLMARKCGMLTDAEAQSVVDYMNSKWS